MDAKQTLQKEIDSVLIPISLHKQRGALGHEHTLAQSCNPVRVIKVLKEGECMEYEAQFCLRCRKRVRGSKSIFLSTSSS